MAYKTPKFQQYTFEQVLHISPAEAYETVKSGKAVLLDIRENWEVQLDRPNLSEHFMHIPLSEIALQLDSLPKDITIVVMCAHGIRSVQLVAYLKENSQLDVINMDGAFEQWEIQNLPLTQGLYQN
jgi:rhodanese-related sulfurtransferase